MWKIERAPNSTSKWQIGLNLVFKQQQTTTTTTTNNNKTDFENALHQTMIEMSN